jgi:meiotic recombination protein DMC1
MKKDLEKIKGFSETKVEKIKEAGKKMMVLNTNHADKVFGDTNIQQPDIMGFITALEQRERRKRCIRISTGSKQLDNILGGCVSSVEAGRSLC